MVSLLKRTIKAIAPPVLWRVLKSRFKKKLNWSGSFPTWDAADLQSKGYASDLILERVASATRKVVNGEFAFERDSVLFKDHDYNWSLLGCLMHIAARKGGIRVIDFGGSLGSTYWQNRIFWTGISLQWTVVEQSHFVNLGKREFETATLKFQPDIDSALIENPNVVLFSSVLSYLPDPFSIVRKVVDSGVDHIIIDLTAFSASERITVQEVPPSIYPASYPCRIFSRESFLPIIAEKYDLTAQWKCMMQPTESDFEYLGFYFSKKAGEK